MNNLAPQPTSFRILAVDDDKLVCYHYRHLLSHNGYQVQTAQSAEQALCLLEQQEYDLVLLDLRMPGMNGMAFLRKLRQRKNPPEVLMISGYATTEDAVEAARLGVANVIQKPCRPEKLLEQIRLLLDIPQNAVITYLRTHFAEILSREEVARHFCTTGETISRRVKRGTGRPFRDFLYSFRLQEAQRLLAETELEAKEIAARVGFRSYHTFSRAFQKQTGHTPGQYRTKNRATRS